MDNRSHDEATWNLDLLGPELQSIQELDVDFDLALTGFDQEELNAYLYPADEASAEEDVVSEPPAEPVTRPGDLWVAAIRPINTGCFAPMPRLLKLSPSSSASANRF